MDNPRGPSFAGVVLAGGSSTRMGCDKASIQIAGETMIHRAVSALTRAGAEPVIVVGGDPEGAATSIATHVPDDHPGEGPLGAIITAFRSLDASIIVVLAVDHLEPAAVAVESVVAALGDSDVAVPLSEGREQWLHSAWRRRVLPQLEAAFSQGARAPRQMADTLRVTWLSDGDPCWYRDADSPSDLPG